MQRQHLYIASHTTFSFNYTYKLQSKHQISVFRVLVISLKNTQDWSSILYRAQIPPPQSPTTGRGGKKGENNAVVSSPRQQSAAWKTRPGSCCFELDWSADEAWANLVISSNQVYKNKSNILLCNMFFIL